jgi:GNAT superfamily N-acetyltransferase
MQALLIRPMRTRALAVFFAGAVLALSGCATRDIGPVSNEVQPFSAVKPAAKFSGGWTLRQLSRMKRDTQYRLVQDASGVTVVEARADHSASGLQKRLKLDATPTPWLQWRWKVPATLNTADNTRRDKEDSPARVIVTFEGDTKKFDFEERAFSAKVKALTGQALPYATLMYIWGAQAQPGEVIESAHTSRIKMIVVEAGMARTGTWLDYERNLVEDFERAFGEKPGRVNTIGIMTDTDNTGEKAVAFYGDIRFSKERRATSGSNPATAAHAPEKDAK